jgi:hypothetical protein
MGDWMKTLTSISETQEQCMQFSSLTFPKCSDEPDREFILYSAMDSDVIWAPFADLWCVNWEVFGSKHLFTTLSWTLESSNFKTMASQELGTHPDSIFEFWVDTADTRLLSGHYFMSIKLHTLTRAWVQISVPPRPQHTHTHTHTHTNTTKLPAAREQNTWQPRAPIHVLSSFVLSNLLHANITRPLGFDL